MLAYHAPAAASQSKISVTLMPPSAPVAADQHAPSLSLTDPGATSQAATPGGAGQAPRRTRRRRQRLLVALGSPLQPQVDRGSWRALSRAERRRRLRAAAEPGSLETAAEQGLEALGEQLALEWLRREMDEQVDELCGAPKGKHCPQRSGRRHGREVGSVVLGGRRVPILRPRARSLDGRELVPEVYEQVQDEGGLSRAMMDEVLAGTAQRRYVPEPGAPAGPAEPPPGSVSRSTVSRRCAVQMTELLRQVCSRDLRDQRYLAVLLDGVERGGHHVIVAMGATAEGNKQVLGLWPGASESEEVCRAALEDLGARGLSAEQGLLVVIDGGKGLAAAVHAVWGERALIQRCHAHKVRNLEKHLPADRAEQVLARVRRAWEQADAACGERKLRAIADELEVAGRETAARSLRDGLVETMTCRRLGLPPELHRSLHTTNCIESAFSRHEAVAHNVKRWRSEGQAQRWLATSLVLAEQSLGRLHGAKHLPVLAAALAAHVAALPPLAIGA